jgi:hypothetical protein
MVQQNNEQNSARLHLQCGPRYNFGSFENELRFWEFQLRRSNLARFCTVRKESQLALGNMLISFWFIEKNLPSDSSISGNTRQLPDFSRHRLA